MWQALKLTPGWFWCVPADLNTLWVYSTDNPGLLRTFSVPPWNQPFLQGPNPDSSTGDCESKMCTQACSLPLGCYCTWAPTVYAASALFFNALIFLNHELILISPTLIQHNSALPLFPSIYFCASLLPQENLVPNILYLQLSLRTHRELVPRPPQTPKIHRCSSSLHKMV